MTTTVNLRKLLHRKTWEWCTPCPSSTGAGAFFSSDDTGVSQANECYAAISASVHYIYNADQDGWAALPASGIAGTFAAGACGTAMALGCMGGSVDQSATAGTTTTLTTSRTIVRDLRGCLVKVVSGTGVGYQGAVSSNTIGANAVLTVTPANGVAFDATTVFRIWSGSLWFWNAGTTAVGFSVYDRATNSWTAKSVSGMPTAWGTHGALIATESARGAFETSTSTGSNTSTTLNNTGKSWATNGYANAQVRITGGTGSGQIRTIASNSATALTVSAAWSVTPDATSTYSIEGNDDYLYLLGNNAVTLYRYQISTNTWSTLSPGTARASAPGAGFTANWITGISDADWQGCQGKSLTQAASILKQNGRYIYSFRGGVTATLDVYDIAGNNWVAMTTTYGGAIETFTAGSSSVDFQGMIYITKEATGRVFRYDCLRNAMEAFSTNICPQSTATEGKKVFMEIYRDGATLVPFLYYLPHNRSELYRCMLIG